MLRRNDVQALGAFPDALHLAAAARALRVSGLDHLLDPGRVRAPGRALDGTGRMVCHTLGFGSIEAPDPVDEGHAPRGNRGDDVGTRSRCRARTARSVEVERSRTEFEHGAHSVRAVVCERKGGSRWPSPIRS